MDEIKLQIAKTNELLQQLLRRDEERQQKAEHDRAEAQKMFAEMRTKRWSLSPGAEAQGDGEPIEDENDIRSLAKKRTEEARAYAEEIHRKETDFQASMHRLLEEQNDLLRQIIEKL